MAENRKERTGTLKKAVVALSLVFAGAVLGTGGTAALQNNRADIVLYTSTKGQPALTNFFTNALNAELSYKEHNFLYVIAAWGSGRGGHIGDFEYYYKKIQSYDGDERYRALEGVISNAVEHGHEELVYYILDGYPSMYLSAREFNAYSLDLAQTALDSAAATGNLPLTESLWERYGELDATRALFKALLSGNLDAAPYLVEEKAADINRACNAYCLSVILKGHRGNNVPRATLEFLIDNGFKTDTAYISGRDLAQVVANHGHALLTYILENFSHDRHAAQEAFTAAVLNNRIDSAKLLLDHGADPRPDRFRIPGDYLRAAENNGHTEMFQFLRQRINDLNR